MKKRFLVLILLLLIVAALPVAASAETQSGTCGDNLTWTLDDSKMLTISGTGAMNNYDNNTGPWGKYVKQIKIEQGVTSIGSGAFRDCSSLTSVTIPNSVTGIGRAAFADCSSLTSVTIPNSVTSIDSWAFYGCSSLTSMTIPNSVTSIDSWAFSGCSGLTSVTIPNGVTSIGYNAFSGCSSLTSVTIPNSVTSIGSYAFSRCRSLTRVTIPNSVTSIGGSAFEKCSSLTSVTIPNSVTSIDSGAFAYCKKLTKINVASGNSSYCSVNGALLDKAKTKLIQCPAGMTGTYAIPSGVTSIGRYAFSGCSSLTSVTIPNSVTSIGYKAFSDCSSLTSVTIPNSVTSIGEYAFSDCSSLTSVTIPNSVEIIEGWTFGNCNNLTSVTIPNSVTSIGSSAFWRCSSLTSVTIPNSVTSIGGYTFYECTSLTSVTIPDSVTTIMGNAFYNCTGLMNITIPESVTEIGYYAFEDCPSGLTVYCYEGSKAQEYAQENGIHVVLLQKDASTAPTIEKQPTNLTVVEGETATFKVTAEGASSYHWYYRTSETGSWKIVTNNGSFANYSLTASAQNNGYQFRCKAINEVGSVTTNVVTLTVRLKPTITKQPANQTVSAGETATFSVTAQNAIAYQWYYRKSESDTWNRVVNNGASDTYSLATAAYNNGYQFRCLVKNSATSVYTNTVTLKVKPGVTTQPSDLTVSAGETATFKVTATGATSYQWYYRKSASDAWVSVKTNGTSATYNLVTAVAHNGYQFRCLVKNDAGSVYTNTVTLKVKPGITTQPTDKTVNAGETATFKVTATGAASYQWYYRKSASDAWNRVVNNGASATYNLTTIAGNNGYQFRCLVKNDAGSVYTNTVTLKVKPGITSQPTDKTVNAGETATFKVTATGAASYQWYYRKSASDAWNRVVNNGASNTYNLVTIASHNGYQFRCLVKNDAGSVYTNTVTLKVLNKPVITAQPTDKTVNAGETASFKVTASKATSYQWYYRKSASAAWIAVQNNGTANTYNLTTFASHNGYQFRCLVKNTDGGVYSNTVTLKVTNKPVITAQPIDKTVNAGETATFKVTASKATSYQWYYRKSASAAWIAVQNNGTANTYNLTTIASHNGYQFRCLVKNDEGGVYSDTVTLKVTNKPVITAQPTDQTVNIGETASFKVTAARATAYQWYYRKSESDVWNRVVNNGTSATYNLTTAATHNGYQFRCLVKNDEGSLYTNVATLTVTAKPTITVQPTDKTVNAGETATFKVTAARATSYQWYYRKTASSGWISVKNNGTSATYNLVTIAGNNGYQFRCEAKNDEGTAVSDIVTLTVK